MTRNWVAKYSNVALILEILFLILFNLLLGSDFDE